MVRREIVKFAVGGLLGILAAGLIAFNVLLLWVATGPRSLDRLTPYIEESLRTENGNYTVKIGQTWLIWDGWLHPIGVHLRDIRVLTKENRLFSHFPEISLGIDAFSLLRGEIVPASFSITHPVISLFQNDDRSISFGFGEEAAATAESTAAETPSTAPLAAALAPLLSSHGEGKLGHLRFVNILDADISVGNTHQGVFFKANHANITFRRHRDDSVQATAATTIAYGDYSSFINAQFTLQPDAAVLDGTVSVSNLMPGVLTELFADNPILNAVKLPMSGKVEMAITITGALQQLHFNIDGGEGSINTDKLEAPLQVKTLHAEGQVNNDAGDIQIDKFTAEVDGGITLAAEGVVSRSNNDLSVRGHATFADVPGENVHLLWPPSLSPMSREWVTTNIKSGKVTKADVRVNIPLGDLAKPVLPQEDVNASIALEGAKIRYLPEHPEVSDVKGTVHVDGVSLVADIASGNYMKDTKLSNGKLVIEDLNADNPYITLNYDASTSARDAVRLLGLPRLKHAERLGLTDAAGGSATGHAKLGFHFFSPRDENGKPIGEADIAYDIAADLKGISQPGFMKKFDIKNADGKLTVNNTGLEFNGKGEVNGASISESDIRYLFKAEEGFDTFMDVMAIAPVETLPRFGYPSFPYLKGTLGIKANIKQGDGNEAYKASIDLTHAMVAPEWFGWSKPENEPADLDLEAQKKNGVVSIPSFHLKGKDMNAEGKAELDKALSGIQSADIKTLHYAGTDLDHFLYAAIDGGRKYEAEGKSADLTAWTDSKGENTFSFEHFPALQLHANVGKIILGKGRELEAIKGEATCDAKLCERANISGKTLDGKPFDFRILKNPNGVRQLSLHSQSAGAFVKALGIIDGMEGGDLTITGNYDDSGAESVLKGRGDINEHIIKHAPVLAKLLAVASLTGFIDTLQGNGIRFVRLRAPFTVTHDVITIKDARTYGDAIGLTADGTITFPKRTLDLEGTIIPSYTINSVLGHVPLVGHILTGGEGQGIIAARYSMKGPGENPDVTVNPLSMLTPGFLRGIFDVFDTPAKKEE